MPDIHTRFIDEAHGLLPMAVALRRRIHAHPELGNDLPVTRAAALEAIADLDLEVRLSNRTSGIVADLRGAQPGPTILLRADMDALPMPEHTGLEFASTVDGRMHACGHDAHTAMLTAAARLLACHRNELAGTVRFMFQPGEESPGGAGPMIEEGLLDRDGAPDAAFAIHIEPNLKSGDIACRSGALLAGVEEATVKIIGRGGHGAIPYVANDPIPVLCELVQAIQTFVTRRARTFDPVVITVGRIAAGTASNVIPNDGELLATVRSFSSEAAELACSGIRRLAEGIAAAHEMRAEIDFRTGYPATYNEAGFVDLLRAVCGGLFGDGAYHEMPEPSMGSEDFSLVLQRSPGAMAFLGVAPPGVDPAEAAPYHSSRLALDEDAMARGIALHAAVAYAFLGRQAGATTRRR